MHVIQTSLTSVIISRSEGTGCSWLPWSWSATLFSWNLFIFDSRQLSVPAAVVHDGSRGGQPLTKVWNDQEIGCITVLEKKPWRMFFPWHCIDFFRAEEQKVDWRAAQLWLVDLFMSWLKCGKFSNHPIFLRLWNIHILPRITKLTLPLGIRF